MVVLMEPRGNQIMCMLLDSGEIRNMILLYPTKKLHTYVTAKTDWKNQEMYFNTSTVVKDFLF